MDPINYSQFIKEQKCPNCGGTVRFVPEKGKLVCEFCDTEFEIKSEAVNNVQSGIGTAGNNAVGTNASTEMIISGFDFRQFYDAVPKDDTQNLPIYYCKSCGAEVIAAFEEA